MSLAETALQKNALVAHIREEVSGPVGAVLDCADGLIADARRQGLDGYISDLEKIHTAAVQLWTMVNGLVDPSRFEAGGSPDLDAFSSKLRHDLRTPITAIKGYGEMLLEDADADGVDALVPDLRRLLGEADHLLAAINLLVRFSASQSDEPESEAGAPLAEVSRLVADAVRTVGPARADQDMPLLKGRILVVDDNERSRDVLERRLLRDGHEVATAADGPSALELVRSQEFDLVLLDMMMPGVTGYEVLISIKWDPALANIPVIMVSALDEINTVVRCIENGAEDYLFKPLKSGAAARPHRRLARQEAIARPGWPASLRTRRQDRRDRADAGQHAGRRLSGGCRLAAHPMEYRPLHGMGAVSGPHQRTGAP